MSAYETQAALAASAQQAQQPFTHLRVLFLGAESQSTNHHFLASWPHAQFVVPPSLGAPGNHRPLIC